MGSMLSNASSGGLWTPRIVDTAVSIKENMGMKRPDLSARNTTHGLSKSHPRSYRTWKDMRSRCHDPKNKRYARYGGRGISICSRWDDFGNFVTDMGERPEGLTIERTNTDLDYSPDNCIWADKIIQANNRSNNHAITWCGVTKNLAQWCNEIGIEPSKVRYRLKQGWSLDLVFSLKDHRR